MRTDTQPPPKSGIYLITNIVNGHKYIGSSENLFGRWKCHTKELKANKHGNVYLQNAWNKYGKDNFKFNTLFYCNKENLLKYEQILLTYYYDNQKTCYNIAKIAGAPMRGRSHTEKAKRLVSQNGCKRLGEANVGAKITWKEVKEIREVYKPNMSCLDLSKKYNISQSQIIRILQNKKWIDINYQIIYVSYNLNRYNERNSNTKLIYKDVEEIRNLIQSKKTTITELSKKYNVSYSCIHRIVLFKTWKEENE